MVVRIVIITANYALFISGFAFVLLSAPPGAPIATTLELTSLAAGIVALFALTRKS